VHKFSRVRAPSKILDCRLLEITHIFNVFSVRVRQAAKSLILGPSCPEALQAFSIIIAEVPKRLRFKLRRYGEWFGGLRTSLFTKRSDYLDTVPTNAIVINPTVILCQP